jgi:hypothetical protein
LEGVALTILSGRNACGGRRPFAEGVEADVLGRSDSFWSMTMPTMKEDIVSTATVSAIPVIQILQRDIGLLW